MDKPPEDPRPDSRPDPRYDRVAALFAALDKTLRSLKLYEGQGGLLERQLDELAQKAAAATSDGEITVRVGSMGLSLAGKPLEKDDKRHPHLFRLFCDGVRELTLLPGIERKELRALIVLLGKESRAEDEDMVTRLWAANLTHVRHYAVDSFAGGASVEASVDAESDLTLLQSGGARLEQGAEGTSTVLSSDDIRLLSAEDRLRWIKGASAPGKLGTPEVAELRALAQAHPDYARFLGIALRAAEQDRAATGALAASPLVLGQVDGMLAAGSTGGVAAMLTTIADARAASPAGGALFAAVAAPERVLRLRDLVIAEPDAFEAFFLALARDGREGALALLSSLPAGDAQNELFRTLSAEGVDLTPLFVGRAASPDEKEAIEAIVSLGNIGTPAALRALGGPLKTTSARLRNAALTALAGRYVPELRAEIGRLLRDPSRDNRFLALGILRGSGDERMGYQLLAAIEDASFSTRDAEEQEQMYATLAALRDNRTLGHFEGILRDKNLFRSKGVVARQLLCVRGLATTGTPEARELLERFRTSWFLPADVRAAIQAALGAR